MNNNISRTGKTSFEFASPFRPVPKFEVEPSFSHKKHLRATPRDSPRRPFRPPKTLPSVSRLFPNRSLNADESRARNVSFKHENSILQSPHYNQNSNALYFDQCFKIEQRLGAGSFGEVFKVLSKEDGRHYAVKRSRDRFRGDSDKRRKLEEVNKHESLSKHPNCVLFHRAWAERGHLYIQTELCQMSLEAYAEEHPNIPESVVRSFLVDLIQGLGHMHAHELLHLDIKPENIFISYNGVCKLGDFGLSIDITKSDIADAQEGDPKYLAPELLQGHFGKHADVFSLGITILELACDLDLPQNGDSWHDLRNGRIPWQLTAGLSADLREIIEQMMHPDFRKRPTLSALMKASLVQRTVAWQRRKRLLKRAWNMFVGWLFILHTLVTSVFSKIAAPLKGYREYQTPDRTDGRDESQRGRHPSEWDLSFSDDEIFESDSSHSSLGALGSISFSSDDDPHSMQHSRASMGRSFQMPMTPKLMKTFRGPTPRSSSPIASDRMLTRNSPHHSPNISLVRSSRKMLNESRRVTPAGTPNKLDFSSVSGDSDTERSGQQIEPRSLSLVFDQLGDESD